MTIVIGLTILAFAIDHTIGGNDALSEIAEPQS